MSLWNDDRQYGTDEQRREWKTEVNAEYRRETACDRAYIEREDGEDE